MVVFKIQIRFNKDVNRKSDSLIFIDGGDPQETHKAREIMGYIDGQTTNPSLVSKNPQITARLASGNKFTEEELLLEYKKIVEEIATVTDGPTSIEVHVDETTTVEHIARQARDMATWIPNAYIKLPITKVGLAAADILCHEMRLNMTLCFSQEQAAAVYSATTGAAYPLYISPFVGRLDDKGLNGMDLVANILTMYEAGDGHVKLLAASIRSKNHLLYGLKLKSPALTLPFKIFTEWANGGFEIPTLAYVYDRPDLKSIAYEQLPLDNRWETYNISHELTDSGLEKFAEDWKKLLK